MNDVPRSPLSLLKTCTGLIALCGVFVASLVITYPLLSDSEQKMATDEEGNALKTDVVIESPFQHTILAQGEVDSRQKATLISEVDDSTRVLWLAPAGVDVAAPLRSPVDGVVKTVRHPNRKLSVIVIEGVDGERKAYEFHKQSRFSEVVITPGNLFGRNRFWPVMLCVVSIRPNSKNRNKSMKFESTIIAHFMKRPSKMSRFVKL